ncbi:MAG: DUF1573 domain-containing protein [Sphingobacteriia bacterium]|jgi:hypothetical protein
MKLFLIGAVFMFAFCSCKNNNAENAEAAKHIVDTAMYTTIGFKDTIINFGTINMGEKTNILFEFTNTGSKPLYLTEVKPGCGCTVADYTKGAIPAGGKGNITASFDSNKSHPGTVAKNIFVTANTSNGITHTLTFNGEIQQLKTP